MICVCGKEEYESRGGAWKCGTAIDGDKVLLRVRDFVGEGCVVLSPPEARELIACLERAILRVQCNPRNPPRENLPEHRHPGRWL